MLASVAKLLVKTASILRPSSWEKLVFVDQLYKLLLRVCLWIYLAPKSVLLASAIDKAGSSDRNSRRGSVVSKSSWRHVAVDWQFIQCSKVCGSSWHLGQLESKFLFMRWAYAFKWRECPAPSCACRLESFRLLICSSSLFFWVPSVGPFDSLVGRRGNPEGPFDTSKGSFETGTFGLFCYQCRSIFRFFVCDFVSFSSKCPGTHWTPIDFSLLSRSFLMSAVSRVCDFRAVQRDWLSV